MIIFVNFKTRPAFASSSSKSSQNNSSNSNRRPDPNLNYHSAAICCSAYIRLFVVFACKLLLYLQMNWIEAAASAVIVGRRRPTRRLLKRERAYLHCNEVHEQTNQLEQTEQQVAR